MLHDPRPPHLQRKAAENKALQSQEHSAGWTPERVELLKKLWAAGNSASLVARILGGGVTRNGVIGKVTRLKLAPHTKPKKARSTKPPKHPVAIDKPHHAGGPFFHKIGAPDEERQPPSLPPEVEDGVDVTHLLGILQINDHTCKWPIGDPLKPDFGFCGEHSREGSPYCAKHHRRAYVRL